MMGYRIDYYYDMQVSGTGARGMGRRLRALTAAMFILLSLGVKRYWPEGTEMMRELFLPQRVSPGQATFRNLIDDLRQGVEFRDALTAFCADLLDHAEKA